MSASAISSSASSSPPAPRHRARRATAEARGWRCSGRGRSRGRPSSRTRRPGSWRARRPARRPRAAGRPRPAGGGSRLGSRCRRRSSAGCLAGRTGRLLGSAPWPCRPVRQLPRPRPPVGGAGAGMRMGCPSPRSSGSARARAAGRLRPILDPATRAGWARSRCRSTSPLRGKGGSTTAIPRGLRCALASVRSPRGRRRPNRPLALRARARSRVRVRSPRHRRGAPGRQGRGRGRAPWIAAKARRVAAIARDLKPLAGAGPVQVMDVTEGGVHALLRLTSASRRAFSTTSSSSMTRETRASRRSAPSSARDLERGARPADGRRGLQGLVAPFRLRAARRFSRRREAPRARLQARRRRRRLPDLCEAKPFLASSARTTTRSFAATAGGASGSCASASSTRSASTCRRAGGCSTWAAASASSRSTTRLSTRGFAEGLDRNARRIEMARAAAAGSASPTSATRSTTRGLPGRRPTTPPTCSTSSTTSPRRR